MHATWVGLAVSIGLLLSGCSSASSDSTRDVPSSETSSKSSASSVSNSPDPGSASASDARGDGDGADLVSVKLTLNRAGMTVAYQLGGSLPTAGTALLSVAVSSQDGSQVRQLGVKYIEGEPLVFVFDSVSAQQQNLAAVPQHMGKSVSVVFPAAVVAGLGRSFEWRAVSNVNGVDVDACPNPGDDVLNPTTVVFPARS